MKIESVIRITTHCCEFERVIVYQLFESEYTDGTRHFGVCIQCETTGEAAIVHDLTSNRACAKQFFHSIVQGNVTPIHLKDLAQDYVTLISL